MTTAQQQWQTIFDQLVHEQAMVDKHAADVMNFNGAAANAKTEGNQSRIRVEALRATLNLLREKFKAEGWVFSDDDGWIKP